jgi:hypothetical protein
MPQHNCAGNDELLRRGMLTRITNSVTPAYFSRRGCELAPLSTVCELTANPIAYIISFILVELDVHDSTAATLKSHHTNYSGGRRTKKQVLNT